MKSLVFFLSFLSLISCDDPELRNPIEGCWSITEFKRDGIFILLDSCTSQSTLIITSESHSDKYGDILRTTFYYDSAEMTCEVWEKKEEWKQYNGEYILDDRNIIDQNEGIDLASEDQLLYFYDSWEWKRDSLGSFEEIVTTPIVMIFSRCED
jgi:hypothetical protein